MAFLGRVRVVDGKAHAPRPVPSACVVQVAMSVRCSPATLRLPVDCGAGRVLAGGLLHFRKTVSVPGRHPDPGDACEEQAQQEGGHERNHHQRGDHVVGDVGDDERCCFPVAEEEEHRCGAERDTDALATGLPAGPRLNRHRRGP